MSKLDVIRAWKDEEYRLSLSDEERAQLPDHPAGVIELMDADLGLVVGGAPPRNTEDLVICTKELDICDVVTPADPCMISAGCDGKVPLPTPPDFEVGLQGPRSLRLRWR